MAIWLPFVLAGLVAGSQFVTNPEDLGKRFVRAQKLLATGDFAGAQRIYEGVLAVPDGVLLRASAVRVVVDEHAVGVQAAARYQLANMGRKQAQLWQQEAALADSVEADSLAGLATASLQVSADRFAALRDEEGFELRETAAYLVVECFFDAEEYAAAAQAGQVLLRLFPKGRYAERTRLIERYPNTPSEAAARCNIGVSYYQMDNWRLAALAYEEAVAALEGRKEEWRALEFARSNREMIGRTYLGEVAAE